MDRTIIDLLIGYAAQKKSALVVYPEFLAYADNYARDHNSTELINKIRDHALEIIPALMQWEYEGACTIFRKERMVEAVLVHDLLKDMLSAYYAQIEQNPEVAFPAETLWKFQIPERLIFPVDVVKDFIPVLGEIDSLKQPVLKMLFPDGNHLIVAKEIVKTRLIECAVLKLARYLQSKMNLSYMSTRLETRVTGGTDSVKNMINDTVSKHKKVMHLLYEGDDFTTRFFTHFTTVIVKDLSEKKTLHPDEQGLLQSAHILRIYIGFQKSIVQRETEREMDLDHLGKQIRRAPFAFSLSDLFNLKNNHGVRYLDKYNRDFILNFIRRLTKVSDPSRLPDLLSLKVGKEKDVFIHKDLVIPVFLSGLKEASGKLYREYLDEWQTLLKNNTQLPPMRRDKEFVSELTQKIKQHFPLFHSLLNPHLLTLVKDEKEADNTSSRSEASSATAAVAACFSRNNNLKPMDELLNLKRERLLVTVKNLLPAWYTLPILKQLFFTLKWLIGRGNKKFRSKAMRLWRESTGELKKDVTQEYTALLARPEEEKSKAREEPTRKEIATQYKSQLETVKQAIVGAHADLDALLATLKEKWNPLFDPAAKADLEEDVDCFIRDYLRHLKKVFRLKPPSAAQVRDYALKLSENKHLQSIKKKENLRLYIEAYILRLLEE